jgi:hypothetical protein
LIFELEILVNILLLFGCQKLYRCQFAATMARLCVN